MAYLLGSPMSSLSLLDRTAGDLDVSMAGLLRMLVDGYLPKLIERERKRAVERRQGEWRTVAYVMGSEQKRRSPARDTGDPKKKLLLRQGRHQYRAKKTKRQFL